MTLSLVIPVYNEEKTIRGCLQSIAEQTVAPDEVILVDNNCTDATIEIAKTFSFVTIITEAKQGRAHARNTGFNATKSDIIGRIDADSRLAPDWVERVLERFTADGTLAGITGLGRTSFLPYLENPKTSFFSRGYYWFVHAGFGTITMWGATMAVRREAWKAVADKVCSDDTEVHEDQDISLCIAGNGGKIVQDNKLRIVADGQAYINLKKALHYRELFMKTKRRHSANGNLSRAIKVRLHPIEKLLGFFSIYVVGGVIILFGGLLSFVFLPFQKKK